MQGLMIKRWGLVIHFVLTMMSWQVGNAQNLVVVDWDSVWTTLPEKEYIANRSAQVKDTLYQFGEEGVKKLQAKYQRYMKRYGDCCFCPRSALDSVNQEVIADQKYLVQLDSLLNNELPKVDSLTRLENIKYLVKYVKTAYPNWLILPKKDHVLYVAAEHEKTAIVIEILQRDALQATRDLEQSELIFKRILQEMGVDKFVSLE